MSIFKSKTCDRCKHYTPSDEGENSLHRFEGKCARIGDVNECRCKEDGAAGWDSDSYMAGVYIGPKFGCIHWEKKGGAA